jgi:hypothetical protein
MASIYGTVKEYNKDTQWVTRHNEAVAYAIENSTLSIGRGMEFSATIARMLLVWAEYAGAHKMKFDSLIGEDYVLGVEWMAMGEAIRGLLNGETGNLDCGTLDAFILDTMRENGFTHLGSGDEL